jgi:hypothetical protein
MSPSAVEAPFGWRVCVQPANARPCDREFRPKPHYTVHATLAEAEAEKQRQKQHFGDGAAICIEPVYPTRAKRERDRKVLQESLTAAGWPTQTRPARPGAPSRRRRQT